MIKRWRHISEIGGDLWVLPIWTSIHKTIPENKIQKSQKDLSNLALYINKIEYDAPHI
jgi:hypothetical protein